MSFIRLVRFKTKFTLTNLKSRMWLYTLGEEVLRHFFKFHLGAVEDEQSTWKLQTKNNTGRQLHFYIKISMLAYILLYFKMFFLWSFFIKNMYVRWFRIYGKLILHFLDITHEKHLSLSQCAVPQTSRTDFDLSKYEK